MTVPNSHEPPFKVRGEVSRKLAIKMVANSRGWLVSEDRGGWTTITVPEWAGMGPESPRIDVPILVRG